MQESEPQPGKRQESLQAYGTSVQVVALKGSYDLYLGQRIKWSMMILSNIQ